VAVEVMISLANPVGANHLDPGKYDNKTKSNG
jgi:hypothetical protein